MSDKNQTRIPLNDRQKYKIDWERTQEEQVSNRKKALLIFNIGCL